MITFYTKRKRITFNPTKFFETIATVAVIAFVGYIAICIIDLALGNPDLPMTLKFYEAVEDFYTIL